MKHYITCGKMNLDNNDPLILRISQIKYKKTFFDSKKYNNININTFSSKVLINPEIKKFFSVYNKSKLNNNSKYNKYDSYPHSYTNKTNKINSKELLNSFNEESIKNDSNNKTIFQKFNYTENLKKKLNHVNKNEINIFYNKENLLLMESFNNFHTKIRQNINQIIKNKSNKILPKQKLNVINNNQKGGGKNKKRFLSNLNINNIINKSKKIKIKNNLEKVIKKNHFIYNVTNRNLSHNRIKNKEPFYSINSKICFPILINDSKFLKNYLNQNHLVYKKYIETL